MKSGAVLPLLLAGITGCGGGASPSTSSKLVRPTAGTKPPMLTGTVNSAGVAALTTTFRIPLQALSDGLPTPAPPSLTCAEYALGDSGRFAAPQFDSTEGSHSLFFQGYLTAGYAGPGTYDSTVASNLQGTVIIGVGVGGAEQPAYTVLRSRIGGHSVLVVRRDGSGTFQFTSWGSDEVRGTTGSAGFVSGTVIWTCA